MLRKIVTVAASSALCVVGIAAPAAAAPANEHPDLTPNFSFGVYQPYEEGADAVTYDSRVPEGAKTAIGSIPMPDGSTKIVAKIKGLEPNSEYGAHVHTDPCGPSGDDAGPHFQQVPDPVQPSVDPAYANPENEVWLDFTTDDAGNAVATTQGNWDFEGRMANSFVIHEEHTHTHPGEAGEAGDRLACLNSQY